jgi:hypothetical protein
MSNILWIQSNQTLALTILSVDDITPQEHAIELQKRGDIPSDWVIAAYNVDFPSEHPQEAYRWNGTEIIVNEIALAEINAKNAQPTKEQLLAELQTLSNKIQALEGAK